MSKEIYTDLEKENISTVDKMRPLATQFMYKLEQEKIKIIMKQEIEQLIEKYNGLLVATDSEIVKFKEELIQIVDKQFE
jgi:DNA-binding transcriptional regulator YbjK